LVCGKKHGRSDDDRITPEQSEVSTSHIYKRPIHLQVASSNFRDELIFAVAPVISRCLFFKEALRGIFLSANKPYNEMMDSNAILPDGKMHGARGPEGSW
jgi:hypothetical protein